MITLNFKILSYALSSLIFCAALVQGNPNCAKYPADVKVVHLLCHTHDDVGWLKTVDQYYYGARDNIQRAGVQYILDSVVDELLKDTNRKFSYVESAFLHRWWMEQDEQMRTTFKRLINTGQLELVNGGWCMNDEAAAYYTDIIDQMTYGLRFLNDTFGTAAQPRVAWQIDPFGHSNEQASLFAQMGFDALFFGRLDYQDKKKRWGEKSMELVWQPSPSLGNASWLFTGVLPNLYMPPAGFCFDDQCSDNPIMDDPRMEDYNVDQKVDDFLKAVDHQFTGYKTRHIMMTMGSDFMYQNAATWYTNLDKLIKYVEAKTNGTIKLVYTTPSCYMDALHGEDIEWPTKQDDFFPYGSDPHAYWSGYFTSRPSLKGFIRSASSFQQAMKQQYVLESLPYDVSLEGLDRALGVAQHHDAVTGTAKQHVTDDYVLRLTGGRDAIQRDIGHRHGEEFCNSLNISACNAIEDKTFKSFHLKVYNSIGKTSTFPVRIPVDDSTSFLVQEEGLDVSSQLVPIPQSILDLNKEHRNSRSTHELVFMATVGALGSNTYQILRTKFAPDQSSRMTELKEGSPINIGQYEVKIDEESGRFQISQTSRDGVTTTTTPELMWYPAMAGKPIGWDDSHDDDRASGAYIFRPNGTAQSFPTPIAIVYSGPVLTEIQLRYNSWASSVFRTYRGQRYMEDEWLVGPIPIDDGVGKEVIRRVTSDSVLSDGVFYTDANGREMQKRVRNYRDTWNINLTEPIASNFYPVTSRIVMYDKEDQHSAFAVLNDRSQAGASIKNGSIELMVHRRLLYDDQKGVGEALNETEFGEGLVVRGSHRYVIADYFADEVDSSHDKFVYLQHQMVEQMQNRPVISFSNFDGTGPVPNATQGLTLDLPSTVHLLTLSPLKDHVGQLLVRLEHMFEAGESQVYSLPVTVSLQHLLKGKEITQARETTLSANKWKDEAQRLTWKVTNSTQQCDQQSSVPEFHPRPQHTSDPLSGFTENEAMDGNLLVTLKPMEIRTFIVSVKDI